MSTRHVSVYIAGKPAIQYGGDNKVLMKNTFKHYVLDNWSSRQCDSWMQNYGTTEPIWCSDKCSYIGEERLYVRLVYCIKHRKSRRCIYVNGYIPNETRKLNITSVDVSKENRLFYDNGLDEIPNIDKVLINLDGE